MWAINERPEPKLKYVSHFLKDWAQAVIFEPLLTGLSHRRSVSHYWKGCWAIIGRVVDIIGRVVDIIGRVVEPLLSGLLSHYWKGWAIIGRVVEPLLEGLNHYWKGWAIIGRVEPLLKGLSYYWKGWAIIRRVEPKLVDNGRLVWLSCESYKKSLHQLQYYLLLTIIWKTGPADVEN